MTVPGLAMASRVSTSLAFASPLGSLLTVRDLDDYFAVARSLASPHALPQLDAVRKVSRSQAITSAAFDSQRWGASYVQSLRMLWDSYVQTQTAGCSHVVVLEDVRVRRSQAVPSSEAREDTAVAMVKKTTPKYRAPPAFKDDSWGTGRADDEGKSGQKSPPSWGPTASAETKGSISVNAPAGSKHNKPVWKATDGRVEASGAPIAESQANGAPNAGWRVPSRRSGDAARSSKGSQARHSGDSQVPNHEASHKATQVQRPAGLHQLQAEPASHSDDVRRPSVRLP